MTLITEGEHRSCRYTKYIVSSNTGQGNCPLFQLQNHKTTKTGVSCYHIPKQQTSYKHQILYSCGCSNVTDSTAQPHLHNPPLNKHLDHEICYTNTTAYKAGPTTYFADAVQVGEESPELVAHAVFHLDLPRQLGALFLSIGSGHAEEALETLSRQPIKRRQGKGYESPKLKRGLFKTTNGCRPTSRRGANATEERPIGQIAMLRE